MGLVSRTASIIDYVQHTGSAHRFSTLVQHTHRTLPISVLIDCPIFFAFVSDTPASIDIRLEAILFGFAKSIYTPEYACNWNIVPLNCG